MNGDNTTIGIRHKGLTVFSLKMIGLILVTLGTLTTALAMHDIDRTNLQATDMGTLTVVVVCEAISWIAIPIYAWLVVTGFHHTHHLGRYMLRVLLLAVASEVPYDMATSQKFWDMGSQNPVWAILAALIVLLAFRMVDPNPPDDTYTGRTFTVTRSSVWMIRVIVVLAALLWMWLLRVGLRLGMVNEGVILIVMVVVFDLLHHKENTMMYTAAVLGAILFLTPSFGILFLHFRNGRLGYAHKNTGIGFYIAYFVQLLVFGALAMAL
jgi:hypothetical protein